MRPPRKRSPITDPARFIPLQLLGHFQRNRTSQAVRGLSLTLALSLWEREKPLAVSGLRSACPPSAGSRYFKKLDDDSPSPSARLRLRLRRGCVWSRRSGAKADGRGPG